MATGGEDRLEDKINARHKLLRKAMYEQAAGPVAAGTQMAAAGKAFLRDLGLVGHLAIVQVSIIERGKLLNNT